MTGVRTSVPPLICEFIMALLFRLCEEEKKLQNTSITNESEKDVATLFFLSSLYLLSTTFSFPPSFLYYFHYYTIIFSLVSLETYYWFE